jgi:uncharacterized membrane protein YkoI
MSNKLAAAAFATLLLAGSAWAQTPPAVQVASISAEQAISIARQHGLVTVEEVDRDGGKWEVEGRDADGREIEVDIDMRTGHVLDVDRH